MRSDRERSGAILRYNGDGHLLTIAPTRAGKGTGVVIPNLLSYPGSVVVTDPKGENYAVTARHRRVALGQRILAFDPFGIAAGRGQSAAYNPIDLVDATRPTAHDDAWLLADMLIVPEGRAGDELFWDEEARALAQGLILHVATAEPPERRTLATVREHLTLPPAAFRRLLGAMLESTAMGGLVARAAARLRQKAARERSGVISSAQRHTHFLDSEAVTASLAETDVPFTALARPQLASGLSVYLILPPSQLESYRRWLRLLIGCAVHALTTTPASPAHRVLFLLDEFPALGRMRPVEQGVSLVGGYGATFWLLVQDLSQLKAVYGDAWRTFVANAAVVQAFGVNDIETAEYLSKMTGDATVSVESANRSRGITRGRSAARQEGEGTSWSERGRRLLTADEVRRLPASQEILFVRGRAPVLARRVNYLADPEYRGAYDANPLRTHGPREAA